MIAPLGRKRQAHPKHHEPMDLQQIGKYRIVGQLGHGAMGDVYKAHDPILNRFCAVKTMTASVASDPELVQRFQREAQSAARLNHPNIVTVYDFGEEQGKLYMAMELLEGEDLKEVIAAARVGDLWDQLGVMEQICDGLAFAHAQGVTHRDLKPANIHIQPNGRVKVMDFGLARLDTSDMTRTGTVMGTPNYMSPEQVRGQKADARSDTFSLGAVFYELLSGHKAFTASNMHDILFKVCDGEPDPIRNHVPDLPTPFVAFLERALRKSPGERFQHAGEMRNALQVVRNALAAGDALESTVTFDTPYAAGVAVSPDAPTIHNRTAPTLTGRPRPGVSGANALDVARTPVPRAQPSTVKPDTTRVGRASSSALPAIGGFLLVIAVAGGAWYVMRPPAEPKGPAVPSPDIDAEQAGVLREKLVLDRIELAEAELQNKSYRSAIEQAQAALRVDPANVEAKEVVQRAEAALAELDHAASEARRAFAAGDTAGASVALGKVLTLDPRHPVAGELTAALNQHFRGQADQARQAMASARTAAEPARSQPTHADGLRAAAEAEGLFQKQEFVVATQRFLEARDSFERAKRAAELTARPSPSTRIAVATPPPPIFTPRPVPTPLPTALPTAAPVATPPPTPPPPTEAEIQGPAIRAVLDEYARALETKDLALFRRVKPNLSGEEQKRLQDAFKMIKSQKVGMKVSGIEVQGGSAVVRVARQDEVNGRQTQAVQQTFRLSQQGGSWVIESIGQ
jgi:serine/threonine protein kinase